MQAVMGWAPRHNQTAEPPIDAIDAIGSGVGNETRTAVFPSKLIANQPGGPAPWVANSEVARASYDLPESSMQGHNDVTQSRFDAALRSVVE